MWLIVNVYSYFSIVYGIKTITNSTELSNQLYQSILNVYKPPTVNFISPPGMQANMNELII